VSLSAVIVDSGLRSLGGHNYTYTRSVARALEARGARVAVLANRGLGAALDGTGFRPAFTSGAYDFPPGHGPLRDLLYVYAQSVVFAEELEHALARLPEPPDLVFSHTLSDFELVGWGRCLARRALRGTLALLLRQTPRYAGRSKLKLALHPYWRLRPSALARLRGRLGARLLLCTDSEALSADYARVFRGPVLTLPIPLDHALFDAAAGSGVVARHGLDAPGGRRVGYLGDARAAKGFPLLPDLARRLLARGGVRVVIQCPRAASGDDHAAPPAGLAELLALARDAGPRLTLVREALPPADYAALLRALDLVLLPYTHEAYREATSGIFAEALALGKPVVVPVGTWMARELLASGAGTVFASPGDLAPAVERALDAYPELVRRAAAGAADWRARHSPESLVDRLLAAAGLTPSATLAR
jgi:glycosyltransferase involved in cell wall biosynthesis